MIFKEIDNMKDVGAICHYLLKIEPNPTFRTNDFNAS